MFAHNWKPVCDWLSVGDECWAMIVGDYFFRLHNSTCATTLNQWVSAQNSYSLIWDHLWFRPSRTKTVVRGWSTHPLGKRSKVLSLMDEFDRHENPSGRTELNSRTCGRCPSVEACCDYKNLFSFVSSLLNSTMSSLSTFKALSVGSSLW